MHNNTYSIYEVLETGSIVAASEENQLLVTFQGHTLNLWAERKGRFENIDCRTLDQNKNYSLSRAIVESCIYLGCVVNS